MQCTLKREKFHTSNKSNPTKMPNLEEICEDSRLDDLMSNGGLAKTTLRRRENIQKEFEAFATSKFNIASLD